MNNLKFSVSLFDYEDNTTSTHQYRDEAAARLKYKECVAFANVGRVKLYERVPHKFHLGGGRPWSFNVLEEWYDNDRPQPEPDVQVEGYIVHSIRTLNGTTKCKSVQKDFHETEEGAIRSAKLLAEKWSDNHEGVVVFKAIKHVHKIGLPVVPSNRVVVDDL